MREVPIHEKNTLRSLRIKHGYTQKEAGALLGVSANTVRSWERDSGRLSYCSIKKIEEVYCISQDYIFFGKEVAFSELVRKCAS